MKGKERILLVDDDPVVLRLLSEILGQDYLTDAAADAAAARRHLSARSYSLMLSDIRMPGVSGDELIRFVRSAHPETAVVVVSCVSETEEAKHLIDSGVYGYIVKPFATNQIRIAVENALKRRELEMRQYLDQKTLQRAVDAKTAELEKTLDELQHAKRQRDLLARNVQNQLSFVSAMMDAMPCPIYYKDADGAYLGCNKAFQEFLRRPSPEIIGRSVFDIVPKDLAAELHHRDVELLGKPGRQTFEIKFRHLDNSVSDVIFNKATYQDTTGRVTGIVGVMMDITERKVMEKRLVHSETRLKNIWESIQIGVMVVDGKTRQIVDVNPEAALLIGLPREKIVGRVCHRFVCPNERGRCPVLDLGCSIEKSERVLIDAGKREIPIIKTTAPGVLNGRRVLIESLLEISDLKRAERELENAHKEMVKLVSGITSIFIGLSPDMTIVQWNRAAEKILGIPADRVLNTCLWDAPLPWDWEVVRKAVGACVADRAPADLNDLVIRRPDGKNGFLGLRLTAIESEPEKPTGVLMMGADITERKILETQLAHAQKLEGIGQLAAGIAHEINTPIQYVGDNIRFLKDAVDTFLEIIALYERLLSAVREHAAADVDTREIEERIQASDFDYFAEEVPLAIEQTLEGVDRIGKIVRSMKEFSHPGADKKISVDINRSLESTISVARNEWKYVADMETDFAADLPLVSCFPGELNQVFLNVIVNAAQAIESALRASGAEKGRIRVSTRNGGDAVEIRIGDTGGGVPEEIRHRIFDPFFTTKDVGKGTGQGLAISHRIVTEKHQGAIRLETEAGKGSTFIIRIPYGESTG